MPAEDLAEFNRNIAGTIAVPSGYFGSSFVGEIPNRFMLADRTASEQLHGLSEILAYNGMDFICEVSANNQAVFLNYAFWLCDPSVRQDMTEERRLEVLKAVNQCWAERKVAIELPSQGEYMA